MLGSVAAPSDFFAMHKYLYPRARVNTIDLNSYEARSSSTYMPFFGIDVSDKRGVNIAVGWTSGWNASVKANITRPEHIHQEGSSYSATVGMVEANFKVLPKEKLMNMSMFLLFRDEMSVEDAQNVHRKFMKAYHSPRDSKGNLLLPPISMITWGGHETSKALEKIEVVKEKRLPYEVYWIDAGWSGKDAPCPHFNDETDVKTDWHLRMGNWRINRYAHPNGISTISDAAHNAGLKMLLWFEPERIYADSGAQILSEHPQWLLRNGKRKDLLLNLGNPDARKYIEDVIIGFLKREKIDIYRQDFNMNPTRNFAQADAPDRRGVTEMKYIEGLYTFLRNIRKAFPDMLIDNCASGGRRIDFKMCDYSVPLCQSDYQTFRTYDIDCAAMQSYGLSMWLPMHAGFTPINVDNDYDFIASLGVGAADNSLKLEERNAKWSKRFPEYKTFDFDWLRKMLEIAKRTRDIKAQANYYPLSGNGQDFTKWLAQQFHIAENNSGLFLCFRRPNCPDVTQKFFLREIDENANYEIEKLDSTKSVIKGKDLKNISITLLKARSCELVFYKKK